jgi:hypothetical protein
MIGRMRTSRPREQGKPAAALAIIATIFATGLMIKALPPATRSQLLQGTTEDLPSSGVSIWSESPAAAARFDQRFPSPAPLKAQAVMIAAEPPPMEIIAAMPLTFDPDPGKAPILQASALSLVALPIEVELLRLNLRQAIHRW